MPERVLVLGNGGFGTAMAFVLHDAGHEVRVWGNNADYTRQIEATRENPKFLPGIRIPDGLHYSPDIDAVIDGIDILISSIPTQFVRSPATLGRRRAVANRRPSSTRRGRL